MKVSILELTTKMSSALRNKGYAKDDIPFIINMYLGGELRGHATHGLAGFPAFVRDNAPQANPVVILKATEALFVVDAQSCSGNIVGRLAADEAVARAHREGVGISIIKNMDNWLRPGAIAEYVADQNLVAIVINSGRGAAVAPPGGYDPVVGTNPIAYGIPTTDGALVVDMASARKAWGEVRLANKLGTQLPADTFYDNQGNITVDPHEAWSVMSFGEYKGFSLAFLIEILCGSLVGMPMMVQSTAKNSYGGTHPNSNGMIVVIDPSQTTDLDEFKRANSQLIEQIKATRARSGESIRIPGDHAASSKSAKQQADLLEISDELWHELDGLG